MNARHRANSRRFVLLALAAAPFCAWAQKPSRTPIEVWKDPGCGCCEDWVRHLEANGFAVKLNESGNDAMRAKLGVPQRLGSCHTGLVDSYAVVGHVPAADIRRLLRERPVAIGLAAPGMPVGAPGMDGPAYGGRRDPYEVLLVTANGQARLYAAHNKT
jgi:hypothetical protein